MCLFYPLRWRVLCSNGKESRKKEAPAPTADNKKNEKAVEIKAEEKAKAIEGQEKGAEEKQEKDEKEGETGHNLMKCD